ncbi:hypothetical protein [Histidinibacterium aquaticum]|uniref:Uncharacterized protein n=1 Tax=Histidinibacterium aquaticum TaxID=2613962 RepID=A0A5J5GAD4_9RHOB|nr:hypothetical protein [Histidinibacterium aquaticum]KAA9005075.1 hypothetical protein F3S47_18780 [Histidinibacterium aquaticum]
MKTLMISAAVIALAGAAHAQEAFVTQLGSGNEGANLSFNNNTLNPNLQVVAQDGNNMSAVNLSNGSGNTAWAHQENVAASGVYFLGFELAAPDLGAEHESLIWQNGNGNNAVNVALDENIVNNGYCGIFSGCTDGEAGQGAKQQTIQNGNNNVAVNWSQDSTSSHISASTPSSLSSPSLYTYPDLSNPGFHSATVSPPHFGSYTADVYQGF